MSTPIDAEVNSATINKKISELKKKTLLTDGQKKAYTEEWKEEQKNYTDTIADLKKSIKELTNKLTTINNSGCNKKLFTKSADVIKKIPLPPPGAKTVQDAVTILDLKVIEIKKQMDLIHDKYIKRQKYFNKLVEEYHTLLNYKNQSEDAFTNSAETVEEDANRKLICHLENEIHRTSVQWMEAEHIRKKYRAIKASLMNDSEKFESSLLELENALTEQQAEINKLQEISKEALEMRDLTKMILQRQEQSASSSNKARDRQAGDFRRLVDERKQELERLERKIFSSGKTVVHQESIGSSTGDHYTGKSDPDNLNAQGKDSGTGVEASFRKLMESTGATITSEVLARFLVQREATTRLNYLRSTTEDEKKHLEGQRDLLNTQLESFKFADIKETEVNQEELEKIKNDIVIEKERMETCEVAAARTNKVIKSIRDALIELLLKLNEIDEPPELNTKKKGEKTVENNDELLANLSNAKLLKMLEDKLKVGLISSGQMANDADSGVSDDDDLESGSKMDELFVPIPSLSSATTPGVEEKPPPYPTCYVSLITGRPTTQMASTSPGQTNTAGVVSEDEGDVPSRGFLKRQAQLIIEAKSRRKGFRAPPARRK